MAPLFAGLIGLVVALAFVVVSATSLLIDRHRLHALAEAAALHASESFDPALLRMGSGELVVPLTSGAVRSSALDYLRHLPPDAVLEGLTLVSADTPDGRRARVRLHATWRPPMLSAFVPTEVRLAAESYSRTIIR